MQGTDPRKSPTTALVEEVADAGLVLGQAIMSAEAEIVATILGLSHATTLRQHPRAPDEAEAEEALVEDGFNNLPV